MNLQFIHSCFSTSHVIFSVFCKKIYKTWFLRNFNYSDGYFATRIAGKFMSAETVKSLHPKFHYISIFYGILPAVTCLLCNLQVGNSNYFITVCCCRCAVFLLLLYRWYTSRFWLRYAPLHWPQPFKVSLTYIFNF